jgi:hypothetical protein
MSNDFDGNEAGMTFRAEVAGKFGKHAMEQLMCIGGLDLGLIRELPE